MSDEDPRAKYWDWISANEDRILSAYHESEECWELACQKYAEDGVHADDVDAVIKWIEHRVNFKQVPDEFVEKQYELSFCETEVD